MIQITDRFYITADTHCYTLQEKTIIKDENSKNYGNEIYKDLGYYVTIESAIKGMIKILTREYMSKKEVNTLKELQEKIEELYKLFEGKFKI